ncbi:MAG: 3-dehydroquinate synthase [candidate division KSB1 bacterium]|nr:3-dehydroquinate synthase [candidate division KSB1 bacterium]
MEILNVDLGERSYPIYISSNSLAKFGDVLRPQNLGERAVVITNAIVDRHYGEPIFASLQAAQFQVDKIVVADGERYKTVKSWESILGQMLRLGCDRQSIVVALGGGVIGDLAGFVAATFMRGVAWVQVPTTLLAQVDASLGGKVGVNHRLGKNMIGAFYQPRLVWIDTATLHTLPPREILSGLAEMLKHGLIRDPEYFEYVERHRAALFALDDAALRKAIFRSCEIKAEIVSQDEREAGQRAILNFGHTIAHGLEAATRYRKLRHGEAVLLGMFAEAYLSRQAGLLPPPAFARIANSLRNFPLKVRLDGINIERVEQCMALDKKAKDGKLRMVLLRDIGMATLTSDWPREALRPAIQFAFQCFYN